jgi:hypothetical protein
MTTRRRGVLLPVIARGMLLALLLIGGLASAPSSMAAGSPAAKPVPGWPGGITAYQGRYKLVKSSDPGFAKSGMLTVFTRFVPRQGPTISGILALYTADDTSVLYVTRFSHIGTKLSASVNLGIYTGPKIGILQVVSRQGAVLVVKFIPLSGSTAELQFDRFSTNPHP